MNRRRSPNQRIGALVLSIAVLLTAAPEAYGLGDCPFHEHGDAQAAVHEASSPGHTGESAAHSGGEGDSERPCAWLADCHLCVFSPSLHSDRARMQPGPGGELSVLAERATTELFGPRRSLFELHLPNAPPHDPS